MYLLDTNVVSELRKNRPHGAVLAWLGTVPEDLLFLSAVTIGEIQAGLEITREQDPAKAMELSSWVQNLMQTSTVLPVDARVFQTWARLRHRRSPHLFGDALLAATAKVHGFTVVTRNVRDFAPFGVPTLNPFSAAR